nr:helix-turn-helix transcriptional regulator [uncultured Prevotella sp.]
MAKKNNLRITEILKSKGLTLGDLAERIAAQSSDGKLLTKSTLCGRINGNPTLSNLYELANALGVKITELFPAEDQATPQISSSVTNKDIMAHEMKKMLNGEINLPDPSERKDESSEQMGMYAGMPSLSQEDIFSPLSPADIDEHIIKTPASQDVMPVTTFCPHCGKKVRVGVVLLPEE